MAQGLLGLTLSRKNLSYCFIEKKGKDYFLKTKGFIPLKEDIPSPEIITTAINDILSREKITPTNLFFTIFRNDLVIRQFILPKMSHKELDEVVSGEIEKIPSFSEGEFEYIYHRYDLDIARDRVIFSAIPDNIYQSILCGTAKLHTPLSGLEIAPLNILSSLYQINKDKKGQALIVLDEKISYFLSLQNNECKVFSIMSAGRRDLYTEEGKLNGLPFINWVEELKRIFKSYKIETVINLGKIWLVWDETNAPDLDKYLSKEVEKEVIKFLPETFSFKTNDGECSNSIYSLCYIPIFSYIRQFRGEFSFEIFLRSILIKKTLKIAVTIGVIFFLFSSILGGGFCLYYLNKQKDVNLQMEEITSKTAVLEQDTAQFQTEKNELIKTRDLLFLQAAFVKNLNRISWSRVFGEVSAELPKELAINSFKISEDGRVKIEGEAFLIDSVANFMRTIENSKVLKNAKFDFLREKKVENKRVFSFGILSELREDEEK